MSIFWSGIPGPRPRRRIVSIRVTQPCWLALLWLTVPAFLGCASATPPASPTPQVTPLTSPTPRATQSEPPASQATPPPTFSLTRVEGRIVLEGRSFASGVSMEVFRIPDEVVAETVAQGLEVPWELAFAPDGRIFVTERPGRIRVIQDGVLQTRPFAIVEQVASVGESGLMGLALHPDFANNGQILLCYTYRNEDGDLRNRVARLTDEDSVGTDQQIILDNIPGASRHDGCRLGFGPDGKLYVTMGDATVSDAAQDLDSLSGKVLRLEADGSVPADNPFPNSYVYTYGHRNPQGLDWHPATGDLFITEHGPDRDDEVNILEAGNNYGWPRVTGHSNNPEYTNPILSFTPTLATAGAAFYSGDKLAASWEGDLVFATLKASQLRRVKLQPPDFRTAASTQVILDQSLGRLRSVALSPDGYLYFSTSNRDGRGQPRSGDDKVLRLVPATPTPLDVAPPDEAGKFALELTAGTYRIRWTAPGFLPAEKRVVIMGDELGSVDLGEVQLRTDDTASDGSTSQ